MGTNAVGGMIVAGPEGFVKNQYRKFNIRSTDITPGDDFGMMREVMTAALLAADEGRMAMPDRKPACDDDADETAFPGLAGRHPDRRRPGPDDGGARPSSTNSASPSGVVAIGVAKGVDREAGRERFFVRGRAAFTLPPRDPVLYFVQRLRDEAHRFAIGSHRARRKKEMVSNPLDEICRHRPGPQTGAAAAFRHRQGG